MKKYIFVFVSVLIFFSIGCSKKISSEQGAFISFFIGEVKVEHNGSGRAAVQGEVVVPDMKISAGKTSFADIRVNENSFRILEASEVLISELMFDSSTGTARTDMKLTKGSVYASISKKLLRGDSYSISTNTAVAATRGTEYIVSEENGKNTVSCLSGLVEIKAIKSGETAIVEPGMRIKVLNDRLTKPEKIPANDMKVYSGIRDDIKNPGTRGPEKDEEKPLPKGIEPDSTNPSGKINL